MIPRLEQSIWEAVSSLQAMCIAAQSDCSVHETVSVDGRVRDARARAHLQLTPSLPGLLHAVVQLPVLREQPAGSHPAGPLQRSAVIRATPLTLALPGEDQG